MWSNYNQKAYNQKIKHNKNVWKKPYESNSKKYFLKKF
jgi:hypothetical protein